MKKTKFFLTLTVMTALLCVAVFSAPFNKTKQYSGNFKDVPATEWYGDSVAQVFELSLMEGVSADKFDTESEMTVAQAITIAARLHSIYNGLEAPVSKSGNNWYTDFVSYCLDKQIITENQFDNYNRAVLSFEMVQLFAKALPESYFAKINNVTYIPDVPEAVSFASDVYLFYNAGVLNGNDEYGTFLPMSAITRKRAAVILSRTVLPEKRLTYSISKVKDSYTVTELLEFMDMHTKKNSLDEIIVASVDGYEISAAEYRYYAFVAENDEALIEQFMKETSSIVNAAKKLSITFSKEIASQLVTKYYTSRIQNYGNAGYFNTLEASYLTDSVFARLASFNDLEYYSVLQLVENASEDEVFAYAVANDYICAKHVLVLSETPDAYKTALSVRLEYANGADFDELIKKYGEDPGMKARTGGYYFTKGWMVKEFEDASYALSENEVSSVVESSYGYHVIKRLPMVKEEFVASDDFATVAAYAGSAKFTREVSSLNEKASINYFENFESFKATL